jgi:tetratricopeptide (TPR) repeat protein
MKASLKRAIRFYANHRYESALTEFLSLDLDPVENPDLSYYLGLCYARLEQYEEAILYLETVVTSDSDILHKYQSRMILSYIYIITGRYALAVFELNALLEEGYESPQVYAAKSYIAYTKKETEESVSLLEKAIAIDPENANALNSLGFLLADAGKDILKALSLCKRAVHLKPDNPAYLDSLGWAYFKIGKVEEARAYLRKALNLKSGKGDNEIARHLKMVIDAVEAEEQSE